MLKKGMKLYSILTGTCPCCHIGAMYRTPNPYLLHQTLLMHEHCSHCNTKYKIEPSFFYGAMYVSYGLGVALAITVFLLTTIIGLSLLWRFITITAILIVLMPVLMRLSRNVWINLFLHYKAQSKSVDATKS